MQKIFACLSLLASTSAFAGGAQSFDCKFQGVKVSVDDHSVGGAQLTISMVAELDLLVNTPELAKPVTRVEASCYNAFKDNDWDRFICTVENQALVVKVDNDTNECVITSAAQ